MCRIFSVNCLVEVEAAVGLVEEEDSSVEEEEVGPKANARRKTSFIACTSPSRTSTRERPPNLR